jgi:hypothetical protein
MARESVSFFRFTRHKRLPKIQHTIVNSHVFTFLFKRSKQPSSVQNKMDNDTAATVPVAKNCVWQAGDDIVRISLSRWKEFDVAEDFIGNQFKCVPECSAHLKQYLLNSTRATDPSWPVARARLRSLDKRLTHMRIVAFWERLDRTARNCHIYRDMCSGCVSLGVSTGTHRHVTHFVLDVASSMEELKAMFDRHHRLCSYRDGDAPPDAAVYSAVFPDLATSLIFDCEAETRRYMDPVIAAQWLTVQPQTYSPCEPCSVPFGGNLFGDRNLKHNIRRNR